MRCFIAAEISEDTKEKIAGCMRGVDKDELKIVGRDLLHITIKFLGEINEEDLEVCRNAIERCTSRKIPVKISGGGAFQNPYKARVIFVNALSKELEQTAKCIHNLTRAYGDDKEFVGHITVARARGRPINAMDIIERLNKVQSEEMIEKIVLKKSTLTPTGPIYEDIYVRMLE